MNTKEIQDYENKIISYLNKGYTKKALDKLSEFIQIAKDTELRHEIVLLNSRYRRAQREPSQTEESKINRDLLQLMESTKEYIIDHGQENDNLSFLTKDTISQVYLMNREDRAKELGSIKSRIEKTRKELWLSGTTLDKIRDCLPISSKKSVVCKLLYPNFTNKIVLESLNFLDNNGVEYSKKNFELSLKKFLEKNIISNENIVIKFLDYIPSYSIFAADPKLEKGYISVELTGYKYDFHFTPNFTLFNDHNHKYFYDYFASAWELMWNEAIDFEEFQTQLKNV